MNWFAGQPALVPIDFSDESREAVDAALELMPAESQIHAIHVAPDLMIMEPGMVWDEVSDEVRAKNLTQAFKDDYGDKKYERVQFHVTFGEAGHEITDYADQIGAGVIIMSSHGRTGFRRVLIGSVAERVVRLANCPVLVLKKKRD